MKVKAVDAGRQIAQELGIELTASRVADVDFDALRSVGEQLRSMPRRTHAQRMSWDDPFYWLPEHPPAVQSQYFAIGNAINFRFWTLADGGLKRAGGLRDGRPLQGSMYMWRSLRLAVDRGTYPLLDPSFLASLTEGDFDELFRDDTGANPLTIAAAERVANLRDLGTQLQHRWNGGFWNLTMAAGGSLVEFARLSRGFRAFDDPLFKLTMVNAIMHEGSEIARFDASPLPAIDYQLLKQLLRQGILRPRRDTASRLVQRAFMSQEEVFELRRVGLHALLLLSEFTGLPGHLLDNIYWGNRRECDEDTPVCLNPALADRCPFYGPCKQLVQFIYPLEETRYY
jgi:hypothetical protein